MDTEPAPPPIADDGVLQRRRWKPDLLFVASEGRMMNRIDQIVNSFAAVLQKVNRRVELLLGTLLTAVTPLFKARPFPPTCRRRTAIWQASHSASSSFGALTSQLQNTHSATFVVSSGALSLMTPLAMTSTTSWFESTSLFKKKKNSSSPNFGKRSPHTWSR